MISQHGLILEKCFECFVSSDCIFLSLPVLLSTGSGPFCPWNLAALMVLGYEVEDYDHIMYPLSLKSNLLSDSQSSMGLYYTGSKSPC